MHIYIYIYIYIHSHIRKTGEKDTDQHKRIGADQHNPCVFEPGHRHEDLHEEAEKKTQINTKKAQISTKYKAQISTKKGKQKHDRSGAYTTRQDLALGPAKI